MALITGIVLTLNEQENIGKCLESIKWMDEIIVVDTGSKDKTLEIVNRYTKNIFHETFNNNFGQLREKALKRASYSWIFMLDADETLPPKSESYIRELIKSEKFSGFWFPRRQYINENVYLKHGYFYPDYQLRLFRKKNVRYVGKIHEYPDIAKDKTKKFNNIEIYHNSSRTKYGSILSIKKLIPYINMESKILAEKRKNILLTEIAGVFLSHIYRSFIKLGGYKDGYYGFRAACIWGLYKALIMRKARNYSKQEVK